MKTSPPRDETAPPQAPRPTGEGEEGEGGEERVGGGGGEGGAGAAGRRRRQEGGDDDRSVAAGVGSRGGGWELSFQE